MHVCIHIVCISEEFVFLYMLLCTCNTSVIFIEEYVHSCTDCVGLCRLQQLVKSVKSKTKTKMKKKKMVV